MSRLGLAGLLVSFLFSFLCGSAGEAKAQSSGTTSSLAVLSEGSDDPSLVRRAHQLAARGADRRLGRRLAGSLARDTRRGDLLAAALVQPAVASGRLSLEQVEAALGAAVRAPLDELICPAEQCVAPAQAAQVTAHYTRFRAASREAHLLELHVQLDAAAHLDGMALPLQLGLLRAMRERVVPALRTRSPDLADRLDADLEGRVGDASAALEDSVQLRLAGYRRADGTLDWPAVLDAGALEAVGGTPHVTLGLFLRELAVVVRSGAEGRIAELFDGLARTDFFLQYGMFSLGASEPRYHQYLERFVRPRFVQELLRTNAVVAAGLALPAIAADDHGGDAVGINLSSLGLSSPATSRGLAALRWVQKLGASREVKLLTHVSRFSGLRSLGGWIYTTAEVLVVVYLTEQIRPRIRAYLERQAAKQELKDAVLAFYAALGESPNAARAGELAAGFHQAWTQYRDFLYAPIMAAEQRLDERLETLARQVKLISDRREALLDALPQYPALQVQGVERAGSIEAYVDGWLLREQRRTVEARVEETIGDYVAARRRSLAAVYTDRRRGTPFLGEVEHGRWHALGAETGSATDPWQGSFGTLADRNRAASRNAFGEALEQVSRNRLETYDDELAAIDLALEALADRPHLAGATSVLRELRELVARTQALDVELGRVVQNDFVRALGATGR